ncbi:hypothetical protein [Pyxidicoccus trucidator]|uniref:hypothetical protein n=1 Tax=Pyxidicoccus trucidator TaxID=2709662 RepID=UPI0013DADAB6|nr:hypothetical protein [Pyxidicoccus trucidator]
MKLETVVGSLALAAALTGGTTFAQDFAYGMAEEPPKDEVPVPAQLSLALRDAPREDLEPDSDPSFLPDLPILVDGVKYTAQQIEAQDIHLSHYVLDTRSEAMGVVQGFRTTGDLTTYFDSTGQFPSEKPTAARGATPCWTGTMYYEHPSYVGSYLGLAPGLGFSYVGSRMNDRISSLKSTPCGSWTALFEHAGFRGHVLWIGKGVNVSYLGNYGWYTGTVFWSWWNDRVSSTLVFW